MNVIESLMSQKYQNPFMRLPVSKVSPPIGGRRETETMETPGLSQPPCPNSAQPKEPDTFALVLRAVPTWRCGPTQRLKLALKALLRGYGLRCVSCRVEKSARP